MRGWDRDVQVEFVAVSFSTAFRSFRRASAFWFGFRYVWGVLTVVLTTALSGVVARYLQPSELVMINLLGVVVISTRLEIGPSLLTAALTSLSFDFFFIPPVFAFAPSDLKSGITLAVMTAVAGIISGLGESSRRHRAAARQRDLQIERSAFAALS